MSWFEWRDAPAGDFAVIGDPVSHSLSPKMHSAAYSEWGLELNYRAVRVPSVDFFEAMAWLRKLGYRGVNVTVPLKELAFEWCDHLVDGADRFGAVNTVRLGDRVGLNTDVPAFLKVIRDREAGPRVLVLGAGGSARAIVRGLFESGYVVSGWNRTPGKLGDFGVTVVESARAGDFDVIVNATSASIQGLNLPVEWSGSGLAFDLAYGRSPFLDSARLAGWRVVDGLPMLVEQGALAFEWWLGKSAPRRAMLESVGL
jgi:shikimate dehydrogenase